MCVPLVCSLGVVTVVKIQKTDYKSNLNFCPEFKRDMFSFHCLIMKIHCWNL